MKTIEEKLTLTYRPTRLKMIGLRLFAFAAAATVAVALPNNATIVPRACGSYLSDSAIAVAEAHFAANKVSAKADAGTFAAAVPVYWHVVQSGTAVTQGNIPDSQITASITAMNQHYVYCSLSTISTYHLTDITRAGVVGTFFQPCR